MKIIVTREELFDLVWARPLMHLARDLGVSVPKLIEACEEMVVPRPAQGHWARAERNRSPEPTALPPLTQGKRGKLTLEGRGYEQRTPAVDVVVPSPSREVRPLVSRTRRALEAEEPDRERGTVAPRTEALAVVTTPAQWGRALEVFERLLDIADANQGDCTCEHDPSARTGTTDDFRPTYVTPRCSKRATSNWS